MEDLSFRSLPELQALLGEQIQQLRIAKNLGQIATAEKAGISEKALRNLEAGRGSTVESLLRILKALDSLDGLQLIVPRPSISLLAVMRHPKPRRRVRSRRASAVDSPPSCAPSPGSPASGSLPSSALPSGVQPSDAQRGIEEP